jgi:hypothetical protein
MMRWLRGVARLNGYLPGGVSIDITSVDLVPIRDELRAAVADRLNETGVPVNPNDPVITAMLARYAEKLNGHWRGRGYSRQRALASRETVSGGSIQKSKLHDKDVRQVASNAPKREAFRPCGLGPLNATRISGPQVGTRPVLSSPLRAGTVPVDRRLVIHLQSTGPAQGRLMTVGRGHSRGG